MALQVWNFQVITRPAGVVSPYTHLIVDGDGIPHLALTEFFHHLKGELSEGTAHTYLHALLPYFTYLSTDEWRQQRGDSWESSPEAVRESVRDYLMLRLACKVRRHETYEVVKLTVQSPSTVKVFLAALKHFYSVARLKRWYCSAHPLKDSFAPQFTELRRKAERSELRRPSMPQISGVEAPRWRGPSDNYFLLKRDDWVPQAIDDPSLLQHLLMSAQHAHLCLRDQVVIRLAGESGARISEVLSLTVGDWRARGGREEANAINKGSRGRRSKYLVFSRETAKLLLTYVNSERKQLDPHQRRLNQLNDTDPLFLSQRGRPYSYRAFYPHWQRLGLAAGIKLPIHGLRHWNVTEAMRFIFETSTTETEMAKAKEDLVRYMAWRSSETLSAYEHFFQGKRHVVRVLRPLHGRMYRTDKRPWFAAHRSSQIGRPGPLTPPGSRKSRSPAPQPAQGWGNLPLLGGHDA